jgi:cytoskeletal protein CcmA (bactofilin family)
MADRQVEPQKQMSPEEIEVRRLLEHLPARLRRGQRDNQVINREVARTTEDRMTSVGSSTAKLEEQLRSLSQDLQRLTVGLEEEMPSHAMGLVRSDSLVSGAVIEADSAIDGVYITGSNLKVDGLVRGEIVCRGELVISEQGVVQGKVEATRIILAGRLEGDVECQGGFVVLSTGWLAGKVRAAEVTIQDGAYYAGELHLHNQRAQEATPRSAALLELLERRKGAGLSLADLRAEPTRVASEGANGMASPGSALFEPSSETAWDSKRIDHETNDDLMDTDESDGQVESAKAAGSN